jgi:hypothetical protein
MRLMAWRAVSISPYRLDVEHVALPHSPAVPPPPPQLGTNG